MGVIRSKDWPLASRDRGWDAAAAEARIRSWAGGPDKESVDWERYRSCFLWYDEEAPDNFTSYKFPYVDIIGDGPKVVFRALSAIIATLNGGRRGPNIPRSDREGVYREAARQYRRFDEEPPPLRSAVPALEMRAYPFIEVRVEPPPDETSVGKIVGYAAVFDTPSVPLGGFREVVRRGAFSDSLNADVRALWNHDPNYVLGRTKNGTLRLEEDDRGLRVEIDPPNTTWARDFMESIRRGDVDQMSFAFRAIEDRWTNDENGTLRELLKAQLLDVSPVTFPAYEATSVTLRALLEDVSALRLAVMAGQEPRRAETSADDQVRARLDNLRRRIQILERML